MASRNWRIMGIWGCKSSGMGARWACTPVNPGPGRLARADQRHTTNVGLLLRPQIQQIAREAEQRVRRLPAGLVMVGIA